MFFTHQREWLPRPPYSFKLFLVVSGAGALVLGVVLVCVPVWGGVLMWSRVFDHFRTAFYFALCSYTTVGYGEALPPAEWRELGAMAAASGFINIGLLTTLLIEGLQHVRAGYRRTALGRGQVGLRPASRSAGTARPPSRPGARAG